MTESTWTPEPLSLPPEWELTTLCSIYEPTGAQRARILSLVRGRPDWDALYRLLRRHRVYPAAYRNLKNAGCAGIGAEFLSALERDCEANRRKALRSYAEQLRLTALFDAAGIRTLSLKGPVLSQRLYRDISVRVSRDLDLMVSPDSLDGAGRLLEREGYARADALPDPTEKQRALLLKTQHHFEYCSKAKGLLIELHWRVNCSAYRLGFDAFWETKTETILNGHTVCELNAEDNLLYLILHGSMHAYFRLKWLCDIQEILTSGGLDLARAADRARALGIGHLLAQAMILCRQFYGTPLHAGLFSSGELRKGSRLARLAARYILDGGDGKPGADGAFAPDRRYILALSATPGDKLAYLQSRLYPNRHDLQRLGLGDKAFALHYLLRPALVLSRLMRGKRREKKA